MRLKPAALLLLLLLAWHPGAQAFSFCFSFGGGDSRRSHYNDYPPPPPRSLFYDLYRGHPYHPVPAGSAYGGYYPTSPGGAGQGQWQEPPDVDGTGGAYGR